MAEALGRLPVAVGLERGGQLGLRGLNQRQITASRQLEQIGIGSIGRYGLLVEAAVELELADRAVERSRRAGRKIPDRHRYGRCRQILAHLLHRLARRRNRRKATGCGYATERRSVRRPSCCSARYAAYPTAEGKAAPLSRYGRRRPCRSASPAANCNRLR